MIASPAVNATSTRKPSHVFTAFLIAGLVLSLLALYWIFLRAPTEAMMGIVQKIFYFHVPAAICMQTLFFLCAGASAWVLIKDSDRADRLAHAAAEVGVLMAAFVLITGPLWARKAWGHYWEWEPRLTLTMVVLFMYVAYLALRSFTGGAGHGDATRRIAAGLAIAGAPGVYLVKIAVEKWRGTHPRVIWSGGLQDPDMLTAFLLGIGAFVCITVSLVWMRTRLRATEDAAEGLLLDLIERDIVEERT